MVDLYSLQGIRLIAGSLLRAVKHGGDEEARTNMALGSLYSLGLAPSTVRARPRPPRQRVPRGPRP
jgi:alcohol dehydrogenase class IV